MKYLLITLALCAQGILSYSQSIAKLYLNTDAYTSNQPEEKAITIKTRGGGAIAMVGGADYTLEVEGNKKLTKKLRFDYFLVDYNDTLFVNCRYIGTIGYGITFYKNDKYIFFLGPTSGLVGGNGGLLTGTTLGIIQAGSTYNYVVDLERKKIMFAGVDFMKELIGDDTELYKKYRKDPSKFTTTSLMKYLKEIFED